MTKISKKIIRDYNKLRLSKIINFSEVNIAKERLVEINTELENKFKDYKYDPSHKIYSLVQNVLSYFSEGASTLKEFKQFSKKMERLLNEFMPSYPPTSPLTSSYFSYWSLCDFKFGKEKETINSIIYDLGRAFKYDVVTVKSLENLGNSYMGFYKHGGFKDDFILLEDAVTGEVFETLCTSGHKGKENEIWYVRLAKNLDKVYNYHVTLTSPYIIVNYNSEDWSSFFERQGIVKGAKYFENKYYNFMKNHKDGSYWHNYILDGYVNFLPNCVFLTGIPDLKGTKPHEL